MGLHDDSRISMATKRTSRLRGFGAAGVGLVVTVGVLVGAGGCLDRSLKPLNPCTLSGVVAKVSITNVDKIDLLFMVDNSWSMQDEQDSLTSQFPRLMRVLTSGDLNEDGIQDFQPVRSLHVGVISSDMGTGGFALDGCEERTFGDDGILQTAGATAMAGCDATYPSFLEFRPELGGSPDDFADDFTCVAKLGTDGCGFEQQLEAVLKAVTSSTSPLSFSMGSKGHADSVNCRGPGDCFLRDDSLLAVVLVTDEDDCSAADPSIFDQHSAAYGTENINLRCSTYGDRALHPISRFVDGLLATRADPDLLVFAAITGVPADLSANPDALDFDAILADPRMEERPDVNHCPDGVPAPCAPSRLVPSCNVPLRGVAFPPRRIVEVARTLERERGSNGIVQSICQEDFAPALSAIIEKIADVLGGSCLPRDLNPTGDGSVNCNVVEVLSATGDFKRCDQLTDLGRTFERSERGDDGALHEVCEVAQVPCTAEPCGGAGWFYDDFSADALMRCGADGQRISFTNGAEPKTGAVLRLECLQPVQNAVAGLAAISEGTPCRTDDPCAPVGLVCDDRSRTCQRACGTTADCPAGIVCDTERQRPVCINPTCS